MSQEEHRNQGVPAWGRGLAVLLPALCLALLVLGERHKGLAYDELHNLAFGHAFLVGTAPWSVHLPVLALNAVGCAREGCRPEAVVSESARLKVRFPTMVEALALGGVVFFWSRALFGWRGALLSLFVVVLNPTVLGHGKEVTGDAATAFFTSLALFGAFLFSRRPGVLPFLLSAVGAGGALLSKQTSVVPLAALAVFSAWRVAQAPPSRHRLAGAAGIAVAYTVLVLLMVNGAYLFRGTCRPLRDSHWDSGLLRRWSSLTVPVPLPEGYLRGIDEASFLNETPGLGRGMNYALGRLSVDRIWYAFPVMLVLKTPLAAFPLFFLGLWGSMRAGARAADLALALIPAFALIFFMTFFVGAQMGIRYLLPALPSLAVVAGGGALLRGRSQLVVGLLLAWYAASTLSYHPHYICYFNELIGSRTHAYRFLVDSNLDWEDRSYFIEAYRREHPDRPFVVEPVVPTPGYVLVGANKLVGIISGRRFGWLRDQLEPVDHVGYSYLLFFVPEDRVEEWSSYVARLHPVPKAGP